MTAKDWAEAVANCWCLYSEVPVEFREEVNVLLGMLLDPDAPLSQTTMKNTSYKLPQ